MRIAVDIDGVLRDFVGQVNKVYEEDFPGDTTPLPVTAWDMHQFYPLGQRDPKAFWNWVFKRRGFSIFKYASPYTGSREMLDELRKQGHHICLLTTQPPGNESLTCDWLKIEGVTYDSLIFSREKGMFEYDILLDDGVHNLEKVTKGLPVCFDQPWNQEWKGVRVKSYQGFLDVVEQLQAGKQGWQTKLPVLGV